MKFHETKLKGAFIIEPELQVDDRGFFARTWCQNEFTAHGLNPHFVQGNMSLGQRKGTLRGLHYQMAPHAEIKLVRCTRGEVYDVIVDLRPDSSTYTQWIGEVLSSINYRMLYVPEGFAHGFQTLEDNSEVAYQVSEFFKPNFEKGIRWNDPAFAISWPIADGPIISQKDKSWPDYTPSAS